MRAARRAYEGRASNETGRGPILVILAVVVLAALIGVGVMVALDRDTKKEAEVDTSTTVDLKVVAFQVDSVDPFKAIPEQFTPAVKKSVRSTLNEYVDAATVTPLRKGVAKDADLATVFDDAALARLATDRAVLLDEGLPKAQGSVSVTTPPINLYALSDANGSIVLVAAIVEFDIEVAGDKGSITITRDGSLTFSAQIDGTWKITGWTLHVERGGPGIDSATTSTSVAG